MSFGLVGVIKRKSISTNNRKKFKLTFRVTGTSDVRLTKQDTTKAKERRNVAKMRKQALKVERQRNKEGL